MHLHTGLLKSLKSGKITLFYVIFRKITTFYVTKKVPGFGIFYFFLRKLYKIKNKNFSKLFKFLNYVNFT